MWLVQGHVDYEIELQIIVKSQNENYNSCETYIFLG